MTTKSNLHTHSVFCDGENTIEEMIQAAIRAGFVSLGFSGHYHTGYDFDDVQLRDPEAYFVELERMKQKYAPDFAVFKGLELESHILGGKRPIIDPRCDFSIGSLHYLSTGGEFYTVDYLPEEWQKASDAFGGPRKLIEAYFEDYLCFAREMPFDIVGHIDIYAKLNEKHHFFDENESWYQPMVLSYIEKIAETGKIFEVNTGAIGKKYRSTQYPANFILKHLLKLKAPVILSSDSHSTATIACHFEQTEKLLKSIGFTEQMQLTDKGFVSVPL